MEDIIEKYSKWFPYCEKEKLKKQMKQDLSVLVNIKPGEMQCNLYDVIGWHYCPKCGMKLHGSGQCVNQLCSGFSRNACR